MAFSPSQASLPALKLREGAQRREALDACGRGVCQDVADLSCVTDCLVMLVAGSVAQGPLHRFRWDDARHTYSDHRNYLAVVQRGAHKEHQRLAGVLVDRDDTHARMAARWETSQRWFVLHWQRGAGKHT